MHARTATLFYKDPVKKRCMVIVSWNSQDFSLLSLWPAESAQALWRREVNRTLYLI
jgi:hypothetical protein